MSQGFSRQLVRKYVQSGWLKSLARGVFVRPTQPVDPDGIILGMQRLAGAPFHLGGLSALNRQGHAHYLPLGFEAATHLWGRDAAPAWVSAVKLRELFVFHRERLFEERANAVGLVRLPTRVRDWTVTASSLERAIMEVLSLVDESESSFVHAAELFEGLTVIRPKVVNELLAACRSLKVKRLFLFLGSRTNIPGSRSLIARRLTSEKENVSSFAAVVTTENSASRCRSASVLSADNPFYLLQ
jgi:hypothetical protein